MGLACKLIHTKNWGILDAPREPLHDQPNMSAVLHNQAVHPVVDAPAVKHLPEQIYCIVFSEISQTVQL